MSAAHQSYIHAGVSVAPYGFGQSRFWLTTVARDGRILKAAQVGPSKTITRKIDDYIAAGAQVIAGQTVTPEALAVFRRLGCDPETYIRGRK